MKTSKLAPGLSARVGFTVEKKHLASTMLSGEAQVLATPMLVAGMEQAAVELLKPFMAAGQSTVGVRIDVSHNAATPLGRKVEFEATLTAVSANGKGFYFQVEAWDEAGSIGQGSHERVLVDLARFEEKARKR